MTESQTIDKPVSLTPELLKAAMTLSLSKEGLAYQSILQKGEDIKFTRDNVNEPNTDFDCLVRAEKILKDEENPFTERWKKWNEARKSLLDPISALVVKKRAEKGKIATTLAEEARKAEAEKQRKAGILSEIDNFFIAQSQAVANATTPEEIVRVEKLIGSHRRASRYDGFYDIMDAKAANLTDLIKQQKVALKELEGLKTAENAANEIGDDQAVLDSREAQEQITAKISENREVVQGTAINMATNSTITEVEVIAPVAPKPRRTSWKYEVLDMKAAHKAGLTAIVLDEMQVDTILAEKRKNDNECTENGIRYYKHFDY